MTTYSDIEDEEQIEECLMEQEVDTSSSVDELLDDDDDEEEEDDDDDDIDEEDGGDSNRVVRRTYIPNVTSKADLEDGDDGEELECDLTAYKMYHKAQTGYPCLSFDIIEDDLGTGASRAEQFPQTAYLVAGTQADKVQLNRLLVLKMDNMNPVKSKNEDDDDEEEDEEEDDNDDLPTLNCIPIPHSGCVNRVRSKTIGDKTIVSTFSETGVVFLWDIQDAINSLYDASSVAKFVKQHQKNPVKPIHSFSGHSTEGYAIDWSPITEGTLATGDCKKHVFIWKLIESGWIVDQIPLTGHTASVEDIQWSPNESNVLATCSVDRSIRIWDIRTKSKSAITIADAHQSDVNVNSWNKMEKAFILSGGDDGIVKVWDLRKFRRTSTSGMEYTPVATFKHHTDSITSVEWHPTDSTVFAASSDDNMITLWDLAVETDRNEPLDTDQNVPTEDDAAVSQLPPQLLFIHQGQKQVKELHWHPQMPGVLISTAVTGFDIFRTISV